MSSGVLDPDADAHELGQHAGRLERRLRELAVGRRGGMDHQRPRVADVGEVRAQLDRADEALARLAALGEPEREHRARPLRQVLLGQRVVRVGRQPAVADPAHALVGLQELGDDLGVGDVRVHPQRQRLHPVQEQEGVERREHAAEVAQPLDAQLGGEAVLAEVVPEAQVAVGGDRLGHDREVAVVPRELAGVDHHAAHRGAVAAEELGRRVDDDVGAVLERAAQVRAGERRVDHQRDAGVVGDLRERLEVGDRARRVGDDLGVEQLGAAGLDRGGERVGAVGGHERGLDPEPPQRHVEQRVGAAVERASWRRRARRPARAG